MYPNQDISQAVSLLKQTLPEMQKRNIAATPENYAVWYEYVSGSNAELINEINLLDANKTAFTSTLHKELYTKHIASAREALVNQLSDSVKDVISGFLSKSKREGEGLDQYSRILEELSTEAESLQSIGEIKLMVAQLIEHTRERETATHAMQESLASMSQEMQKLREQVAMLSGESGVDPTTRIATRKVFEEDLESHFSMAQAENEQLSLVLLEVDSFGDFRKRFGDAIGDKVLKFIATLFKKNIKGSDLVARYGQETFALLLPETTLDGATAAAENLGSRLAKQTLSDSAEKVQLGTITVSAGVTSIHEGDTLERFLQRTEAALSAARAEGGNRTKSV